MAKIVSRVDTETGRIEALQEHLINYSLGAVNRAGQPGVVQVGDTLDDLIAQAGGVMAAMAQTLEHQAVDLSVARLEATQYSMRVDELESVVENLLSDIAYDEALDHAAADLMDCMCSSGAADVDSDGDMIFDERVAISKADIKPWLRQAIVRWIELKLQQ